MEEYILVDQTKLWMSDIVGTELVEAGVRAHGGQVGAAATMGQTVLKCQTGSWEIRLSFLINTVFEI